MFATEITELGHRGHGVSFHTLIFTCCYALPGAPLTEQFLFTNNSSVHSVSELRDLCGLALFLRSR